MNRGQLQINQLLFKDLPLFSQQCADGKLKPILILGSRQVSPKRIQQLAKQLITKRPVVWGCLTEKYIQGLENSPQFQTLSLSSLNQALTSLQKDWQPQLPSSHSITILPYSQTDTCKLIKSCKWSGIIAVYGSWHRAFHYREEYKIIKQLNLTHKLVSGFVNEKEAFDYFEQIKPQLMSLDNLVNKKFSDKQLLELAQQASLNSFDYSFQTGAVLAKDQQFLLSAHNQVMPYETYMLHKGASKEKYLTPPQDLNYFDTNHAEVELIIQALNKKLDLTGCSLYINLLPCPICARMLARTTIKEVVYQLDHSSGYGEKVLKKVGIEVRKV